MNAVWDRIPVMLKPSARILLVPTDVDAFQVWREPAKPVVVSFSNNVLHVAHVQRVLCSYHFYTNNKHKLWSNDH